MAITRSILFNPGDDVPVPQATQRVVSERLGKPQYLVVETAWEGPSFEKRGGVNSLAWYPLVATVGGGAKAYISYGHGQVRRKMVVDWGQVFRVYASYVDVDLVFPFGITPAPYAFKAQEIFSAGVGDSVAGEHSEAVLTEARLQLGQGISDIRAIPWGADRVSLYSSQSGPAFSGTTPLVSVEIGAWDGTDFRPYSAARYSSGQHGESYLPVGACPENAFFFGNANAVRVTNQSATSANYVLRWTMRAS